MSASLLASIAQASLVYDSIEYRLQTPQTAQVRWAHLLCQMLHASLQTMGQTPAHQRTTSQMGTRTSAPRSSGRVMSLSGYLDRLCRPEKRWEASNYLSTLINQVLVEIVTQAPCVRPVTICTRRSVSFFVCLPIATYTRGGRGRSE